MGKKIRLRDVHCSIKGLEIIKGIFLSIGVGEVLVVVGRGGSGKTALLKLCAGIYTPNVGTVHIDSIDINKISSKKKLGMMTRIGFIPQTGGLIANLSVFDNIALPLRYHNRHFNEEELVNIIMDRLNYFNTGKIRDQFPDSLSPGQKRVICFIRETITDNDILILDDPSSDVDTYTSREFINTIKRSSASGCTVIVATHNQEIISSIRSNMVVLSDGKVVGYGKTDSIVKSEDSLIKPIMVDIGLYQGITDDILKFLEDEML